VCRAGTSTDNFTSKINLKATIHSGRRRRQRPAGKLTRTICFTTVKGSRCISVALTYFVITACFLLETHVGAFWSVYSAHEMNQLSCIDNYTERLRAKFKCERLFQLPNNFSQQNTGTLRLTPHHIYRPAFQVLTIAKHML
jgi:hypothetical protein